VTSRTTPVVVCIDIEPDDRQVDASAPEWLGVEATSTIIERWRESLDEATGHAARFSWFWRADPQIADAYGSAAWGFQHYHDVYTHTSSKGDAHGIHSHSWRRLPTNEWVQDRADARWVETCVDMSLTTFREVTGRRCRITRLGDRALDSVAYRCLARHGVRVDLSVEPGEGPFELEATAPSPDFASAPTWPYRPRRHDVTRPRRLARGPVLLPLSATVGEGPEGGGTRLRTVYPWLPSAPTLAAQLLDQASPYLAFAVRSDIGIRPELSVHFEALLGALAAHPRATSLRFVTPLEAVDALRRVKGARSTTEFA
jgi:hypothetical protein